MKIYEDRTVMLFDIQFPIKHITLNLLCLSAFFYTSSCFSQDSAVVHRWKGSVVVNGKKIQSNGSKIPEGATIEAQADGSFIDLKLADQSLVRLVHGKVRADNLSSSKNIFTLLSGKLYSYIQKTARPDSFMVHTKTAVMGVRGTKFVVEESTEKSYLCVCEGLVHVSKKDKAKSFVDVAMHEDLDIVLGKELNKPKESKMMSSMAEDVFKDMLLPVAP